MCAQSLRPFAVLVPANARTLRSAPMVGMESNALAVSQRSARMQIVVESVWFEQGLITLDVQASDTVAMVKAQIHGEEGIRMDQQELYFHDENLMDTEPRSRYNIGDGATLVVWVHVLIEAQTYTQECYELMRQGEKVGNVGCRLCWCWMSPASEESHWNSKNKHGKRLRAYTGPPDPNNFREVKTLPRPAWKIRRRRCSRTLLEVGQQDTA